MSTNYDHIINEFQRWYPSLHAHMVSYKPSGQFAIAIFLDDSSVVEYGIADHTLRDITHICEQNARNVIDEETWRKEFGYRLRRTMSAQGVTQDILADKAGISRQMLGRYLRGSSTPSGYTLVRLSEVLNCNANDLTNFDYLNQED